MERTPFKPFFVLALLMGLLAATPATAQHHRADRDGASEDRVERRVQQLDRRLDLTDAQEATLSQHLLAQHEAAQAWHAAHPDATRDERKAHQETLRRSSRAALEALLTTDQRARLQEMGERRQEHRGERGVRGQGRRGGHLGAMARHLELTDAQREEARVLMQTHQAQAEAWRAANPEATRQAKQAQREAHRATMKAALDGLLTPAQQEKLETVHTRRGEAREGHRRSPRRHRDQARHMARALDLTEAQRTRLRDLTQTQREQAKAWRAANPDATREAKRAQHEAHRAAMEAALNQVLTPAQQAQWETMKQQRQEKMQQRRGRGHMKGQKAPQGSARQEAATRFALSNYPNPFNPSTEIRFTLPAAAQATLAVYDLQGREVARLVEGQLGAGPHAVSFTAANLPTGTYLYRLTVGNTTETGRMLLVK